MNEIRGNKHPSEMNEDEKLCYRLGLDHIPSTQRLSEIKLQDARNRLDSFVTNYIDSVAVSRGYGDKGVTFMLATTSIVGYEGDKNAYFANEAAIFKDWRSDVWSACIGIQTAVLTGTRSIPTEQELIAELPVIDWNQQLVAA